MAFKSIGQKYGFVSAGDVYRQRIADARLEEQAKAQVQIADARLEEQAKAQKQIAEERQKAEADLAQNQVDTEAVLREMGISEKQIEDMQARLEALRQSRLSKTEP